VKRDAPLLEACCQVIGRPLKLSAMPGRTVLPGKPAQELHVDHARDALGWTLVGFIFMIDEFRRDNGTTCFLPGSHEHTTIQIADDQAVSAHGPAGSMIIYKGPLGMAMARTRRGNRGAPYTVPSFGAKQRARLDLASRIRTETLDSDQRTGQAFCWHSRSPPAVASEDDRPIPANVAAFRKTLKVIAWEVGFPSLGSVTLCA
jgi:hypothetical protein